MALSRGGAFILPEDPLYALLTVLDQIAKDAQQMEGVLDPERA